MRFASIAATGRHVPERVVTNAELEARLGEPVDQWLVANVGIRERHVIAAGETTSDLAVRAARQCLERAGRSPDDLDLLVVATDTPDYLSPATASVVQAKLRARHAAIDVNCACVAWVTALDVAARRVATDPDCELALVVGAYAMTRFLHWSDKHTATLFAGHRAVPVHPAQPAHHRDGHGRAGPAARQDPLDHGALGLHAVASGIWRGSTPPPTTGPKSPSDPPPAARMAAASAVASVRSRAVQGPLSVMARWNRPLDFGEARWAQTLTPPADSPKMVTSRGSPPKPVMLRRTHRRAACWSWTPKLPDEWSRASPLSPGGAR